MGARFKKKGVIFLEAESGRATGSVSGSLGRGDDWKVTYARGGEFKSPRKFKPSFARELVFQR